MLLRIMLAVWVVMISAAVLMADSDPNGLDALRAAAKKSDCPCGVTCDCVPCVCANGVPHATVIAVAKSEALPHAPAEPSKMRAARPPSAAFAALWARGVRNGEKVVIGLNCEAPTSMGEWTSIEASETDGFRPGAAVMVYIGSNGSLHGGYRLPEDASQSEIRKMLEKVAEPTSPAPQLIQQQPQVIYMQPSYGGSSFGFGGGSCGPGGCR